MKTQTDFRLPGIEPTAPGPGVIRCMGERTNGFQRPRDGEKIRDRILRLLLTGALSLAGLARLSGDSFRGIGHLPQSQFVDSSEAWGVSADGTVVVGQSTTSDPNQNEAFRWSLEEGMEGIGYLTSGEARESCALAVSADGTVIVGFGYNVNEHWQAFRWTRDEGMQALGDLEGGYVRSLARGISADGSVIVGESSAFFGDLGFTWTQEGGMARIVNLPEGFDNSSVRGISADGTVLVGQASSLLGYEAFRLAGDEIRGLGDLPGGKYESIALGVSADGATVVGFGNVSTSLGREAFHWTETSGLVGLGFLGGGTGRRSEARDVTADGRIVVGQSSIDPFGLEAFIWDEVNGMRNLKEELVLVYGLDLTGWDLLAANGISDDGSVIVGSGHGPKGLEAWVAHITPKVIHVPPIRTWLFSGPIRQNEINLPGSPYPNIALNDTMYGSFSIGEDGSDARYVPPGSYSFSGLRMVGSIAWENAVTITKPISSPIVASFRNNAVATSTELRAINFYLNTNFPSSTRFDMAAIETAIVDGDHELEFGVRLISRDLDLFSGTAYQPFPTLSQVDLGVYFIYDAYAEEPRLTATGLITEWRAPVEEIAITAVHLDGDIFTIYFTSTPGVKSWTLKGGNNLRVGFPQDLTDDTATQFIESAETPGRYLATVDISGLPPHYFFRVEEGPRG